MVVDACFITQDDAEIALGGEIEAVQHPFGEGLLEGDPAEFAGVCAYRPSGVNDGRVIAIGVTAPGSITPEEFDELTEDGIPLGGPGAEGYAVGGGVVFRSGDLIVGIVVITGGAWTPTARSRSSWRRSPRTASRRDAEV